MILPALLLVAGCTTMMGETKPPDDWPRLQIVEHPGLTFWETQERCYKYLPLSFKLMGGYTEACSEFIFSTRQCQVYYWGTPPEDVRAHELEHCQGYDHDGASEVANAWINYKARGGK